MRLHVQSNPQGGPQADLALTPEEAENLAHDLQRAVRNVREGQGERLLYVGDPVRLVVGVQDTAPLEALSEDTPSLPLFPGWNEPLRPFETVGAFGRAGFVVALWLLATFVFFTFVWGALPSIK